MAFRLAHHFDEHSTLPSALTAKVAHGLLQAAHEHLALHLEHPNWDWTWYHLRDVADYLEDFF